MPPKTDPEMRPRSPSPRRQQRQNSTQLMERVTELERTMKIEDRTKKREEKQKAKEMAEAKKKITKEMTMANRLLRSTSVEVSKLEGALTRVEKQKEQLSARKVRADNSMALNFKKVDDKHDKLEGNLLEKTEKMGEARGRLAHVEFAAKMLELGVVLPMSEPSSLPAILGPREEDRVEPAPGSLPALPNGVASAGGASASGGEAPEGVDSQALRRMVDTLLLENRELEGQNRELQTRLERLMAQTDGKLSSTTVSGPRLRPAGAGPSEGGSPVLPEKDMEDVSTNATLGKSYPSSPQLLQKPRGSDETRVIYPSRTEASSPSVRKLSPAASTDNLLQPQPPRVIRWDGTSPRLSAVASVTAMPPVRVSSPLPEGRSASVELPRGRVVGLSPDRIIRRPPIPAQHGDARLDGAGLRLEGSRQGSKSSLGIGPSGPAVPSSIGASPLATPLTTLSAAAFGQPVIRTGITLASPQPCCDGRGATLVDRQQPNVESIGSMRSCLTEQASYSSVPSLLVREPMVVPPGASQATPAGSMKLAVAGDMPSTHIPVVRSPSPQSPSSRLSSRERPTSARLSLDAVVRKLTARALREYGQSHTHRSETAA